jgi:hypothetical protein
MREAEDESSIVDQIIYLAIYRLGDRVSLNYLLLLNPMNCSAADSAILLVFVVFQLIVSIVPLFWSQPGLALKPPPKLDRPVEEALAPARTHFQSCAQTCTSNNKSSPVVCVNLVEKSGREGVVGGGFGQLVNLLKEADVKLVE